MNPQGLTAYLERFLEWSLINNYACTTVQKRGETLREFIRWCEERDLHTPQDITPPIVQRYQKHLFYRRKSNGQPLTANSQRTRLGPIKAYFKWLARQGVIDFSPASELEMPRVEQRLPKAILTPSEIQSVLQQADTRDFLGIRDRAIMETLYSTGVRRLELISLQLRDVDMERGALSVRQGKGRKDRIVPIGATALQWLNQYLQQVRPQLIDTDDDGTVFLSHQGAALTPSWLSERVRTYIEQADLGKTGSCHLFRHSMATQMLENGADIRFIQAMLGHADISTTQIYTQVAIRQLKAIHTATHPTALDNSDKKGLLDNLAREAADELDG